MLFGGFERRFRRAIQNGEHDFERTESIQFATDFARLAASVLQDNAWPEEATAALGRAIQVRARLSDVEVALLLEMALAPDVRSQVTEREFFAFEYRFGRAHERALRQAVAGETHLGEFAQRYDDAEVLLFLDTLFSISAIDGQIDRTEIARLTETAEALGVESAVVASLFRKHDPRHARGEMSVALEEDRIRIGRATHLEVPLPDPQVSRHHVDLIRSGSTWTVVNRAVHRPTLLNGQPIQRARFRPGDRLRLGSYALVLSADASTLDIFGSREFTSLSVRKLQRSMRGTPLLQNVTFTAFSREVVAIVGPSGSGKTTLLSAISGAAPADAGDVILDGRSLQARLHHHPTIAGIAPQDDRLHGALTVRESLTFAARLRFPQDVSEGRIQELVLRVMAELDLSELADARIGDEMRRGLSGGQRKRVHVGHELLAQSTRLLLLDEPTSGLDPSTSLELLGTIRRLADDGRTVLLTTHDVSPAALSHIDQLLILAPGGSMAWFGPPDAAAAWFNTENIASVFPLLRRDPAAAHRRFRNAPAYRKYVQTREHLARDQARAPVTDATQAAHTHPSRRKQFTTLCQRLAITRLRDLSGVAVQFAQAPVLGVLMCVVFPRADAATLFTLVLSCVWFGASGSVRELVADRARWRREARVGLSVWSYMASKLTWLFALTAAQSVVLTVLVFVGLAMGTTSGTSLPALLGVAVMSAWTGVALALAASTFVRSVEGAISTLPLIVIPQLTFGGLIVSLREMGTVSRAFASLMPVRYALEAAIKTNERLSEPVAGLLLERPDKPISGILYSLGFRQTAALDDRGIPFEALLAILAGFTVVGVAIATYQTWIHRKGD